MTLPAHITYIHKEDHRNARATQKSQWSIERTEELISFDITYNSNWLGGNCGWGLHITQEKIFYLGYGAKQRGRDMIELFIARFDEGNPDIWHGCPADPQVHNQDIPPNEILAQWVERRFINNAQRRKIMKGQPCAI